MERSYAEALQLALAEGCISAGASSSDASEAGTAAQIKVGLRV